MALDGFEPNGGRLEHKCEVECLAQPELARWAPLWQEADTAHFDDVRTTRLEPLDEKPAFGRASENRNSRGRVDHTNAGSVELPAVGRLNRPAH